MGNDVRHTAQDALRRIGLFDAEAIDPAEGALWLAKWGEPKLNLDAYRRHLKNLVDDARAYVADDHRDDALVVEAVQQVLARRYGYVGAANPAERNDEANIAHTIDRRRGGAMVLALLYRHVFHALGRQVEMIDFAPRTLIGMHMKGARTVLDPFDGGKVLGARELRALLKTHQGERGALTPDHLKVLSSRQALLSLQHDIKAFHLLHAAPEAALMAVEGALLIAPDAAPLWRELALLHERLDHLLDATHALEHYLQLPGSGAHRYTASQKLQSLQRRLKGDET